jgi:hypothetical protein
MTSGDGRGLFCESRSWGSALSTSDGDRSAGRTLACDVARLRCADVRAIDALARLQLSALRHGTSIGLCGASPELRDLLVFVGLAEQIPCLDDSVVEAVRQPEEGKHPGSVEEEGQPADPVAGHLHDLE